MIGRAGPFVVAAGLALGTMFIPPGRPEDLDATARAGLLTALIFLVAFVMPWRRLPAWMQSLPPLAYFVVIALLREAGGGASSGFGMLVMLPVFWLALYGTRTELAAALALAVATFVAPIVVVGPPQYPTTEWRTALLWAVVAPLVGLSVQELVRHVRHRASIQAAVAALARELPSDPNARQRLCEAACELTGAPMSQLLEPDGKGSLVSTAMAGVKFPRLSLRIGQEPSGAVIAMASQETFFFPEVRGNPALNQTFVEAVGACAALFEPVMRGSQAVGVLALMWREPVPRLPEPVAMAAKLMASEAAVAIERADLLGRLETLALTDSLTGLPNRRAWMEELPREISRSRRSNRPLCIALLDLDNFKAYNDTHGHPVGDALLKRAAAAWRAELRDVDLMVRYGGEEFAVFLHECGLEQAEEAIGRVCAVTPGDMTCSAGIAAWDRNEDFEALTARADRALYAAKRGGRNRVVSAATNPEGPTGHGRSGDDGSAFAPAARRALSAVAESV